MRMSVFVIFLASILSISIWASPQQRRPKLTEASSRSNSNVEYLKREVRKQLVTLPYFSVFDWLEAEVMDDGTIYLRGETVKPTTASDAANRVKKIEGVEKVVNQIEVLPLSPNDDRIRRDVYRTLFGSNSPLFRYGRAVVPSIHIIVKDGKVVLKGVVANKTDNDIANIRANGVEGVFSVKNELKIEKSIKK